MSLIELTIPAREADIGGFSVKRLLPYVKRRMVGPFIFLDHMGPAQFAPGEGLDVRPHPHIGLATVTYLFKGEIIHRDSLGSYQAITPGDVNWMTAGRGIAHSERTGLTERGHLHHAHGLQSWVALPKECEEQPPEFLHHAGHAIPHLTQGGAQLRIVAGTAYGAEAPVKIYSPLFYVEAKLIPGARLELPEEYVERAVYVIDGKTKANGQDMAPHSMSVFAKGKVMIEAETPAHIMLLGGEPMPEQRFIWWNFVSTSKDRIEQAKEDWRLGKFDKIPGDDKEFVPLPEGKAG